MTFKLQIISDTHTQDYELNADADLIVHLGDFSNGRSEYIDEFVNKCKDINKPYVFVLGNHDFYHRYIEDVYKELDDKGYNYLTTGKEFKFQDKTFVGGTLWSNFRASKVQNTKPIQFDKNKEYAKACVNDFNYIYYKNRLITPEDYITLFNEDYNWINKYRGRDDVVVMTHFPANICCLDPYWGNHPTGQFLNPYFINDLDCTGFPLILSGHTHTAIDKVVDGTRFIINPFGHFMERIKGNGYRENLLIKV